MLGGKRHAREGGHPSPAGCGGAAVLKYLRFLTDQEMDPRFRGDDGKFCGFRSAILRGLAVMLLLMATLSALPVRAAVFYPESFTLDNGLQVVVVQNRLSPAVAQMVWYKVGSADEDKGRSGLAHYLEHLMFRGTATMEPGAFSKIIAAQGGRDNAFTSYDYTAYHEIVAADRLEKIMAMEADRMRNLRITPATATPELGVVLNERHQRTDNNPEGKFVERMRQALFPDHPYGVPVIGWRKELERMTPVFTNSTTPPTTPWS